MKLSQFAQHRVFAAIIISAVITALSAVFIFTGLFNLWHLKIADTLYTRNEPSKDIIIVAIDDKSTSSQIPGIGRYGQWGRENYARLLRILTPEKPKVIMFDIMFGTYSKGITPDQLVGIKYKADGLPADEKLAFYEQTIYDYFSVLENPSDKMFADELAKHQNIVLAGSASEDGSIVDLPIPKFLQENIKIGITNVLQHEDGILRQAIPSVYQKSTNKTYEDIALATARLYLGDDKFPELKTEDGKLNVNFFGDPFSFTEIPFVDVLSENFEQGTFKDKIVLIGVSKLRESTDRVLTPMSKKVPMPGVEFRANEIQTILEGKFLTNQGKTGVILTILIGSFLLAALFNYSGIVMSTVVLFLAVAGYYFAAQFLYFEGFILNMIHPFIAIIFTYMAAWIYRYFIADRKKREIKSAFGHYVSAELVEQISKNPDMVHLGGEKRVITVFFSDLKNSTALSEQNEISSWVSQINEYFTVMENVVKRFGGTIDKYEGDAIMGFWNAPVKQDDHVIRAYLAAAEMKKYLKILNERWRKIGKPLLEVRIGINTGEAVVGNMGSNNRFDYTAMGDTVNTASRLESCASKLYGGVTVVMGFQNYAKREDLDIKVVLREIDTVLLPGKKEPVIICEMVCAKTDLTKEIGNNLLSYAQGLAAYRAKGLGGAEKYFADCKADAVAEVMLARIKILNSGVKIPELDDKMVYKILNK